MIVCTDHNRRSQEVDAVLGEGVGVQGSGIRGRRSGDETASEAVSAARPPDRPLRSRLSAAREFETTESTAGGASILHQMVALGTGSQTGVAQSVSGCCQQTGHDCRREAATPTVVRPRTGNSFNRRRTSAPGTLGMHSHQFGEPNFGVSPGKIRLHVLLHRHPQVCPSPCSLSYLEPTECRNACMARPR